MISIGHLKTFAHIKKLGTKVLPVLIVSIFSTSAHSGQSLIEIQQRAKAFLEEKMAIRGINHEDTRIQVTSPDKRLKLGNCLQPLDTFQPINASLLGNTTVGVRCHSPSWQIYLPAKVEQLSDVWVFRQNYQKGDIISSQELSMEKRPLSARSHPISLSSDKFKGLRASKTLRRGQIVEERDLCLICKGDNVELVVEAPTLTVRMNGISLNDGIKGQPITVRNSKSKKLVTGIASASGIIQVAL